jgi:CrcB protein
MEQIQTYLLVMLGGTFGVAARMWMSSALSALFGEGFPIGTLTVNVLGCFIIGLFSGMTGPAGSWVLSLKTREAVTVGILGGFTTFSSFSIQTINLLSGRQYAYAMLNVFLSVALCLVACWLGLKLALVFCSP